MYISQLLYYYTVSSIFCQVFILLTKRVAYGTINTVMKLLEKSYGDCHIFSTRPYGYKRYIVEWSTGEIEIFSSIWYKLEKVKQIIEDRLKKTYK